MAGVLCSMLGAVPPSPVGGTSIYFDGSGDYISARGMGAHTGYPMTIEMWIYPASTTINGLFDSAPNTAGGIRNWGANVAAVQGQEGTGATFTVSANVWQHIAFVYDDGSIKVYVNGTLNASGTFSTAGFSWAYFGHEATNNGTMNFGTIGSTTRAPGTSLAGVAASHARIFVGFDTKLAFPTGSPAGGRLDTRLAVSPKIKPLH